MDRFYPIETATLVPVEATVLRPAKMAVVSPPEAAVTEPRKPPTSIRLLFFRLYELLEQWKRAS